ncbi:hypothetical protein M885DRAFT_519222 [Pelagophyceae sp. CCMP2097]|nr:hypothetical protein M885DRAFT_519222 [Pelagophyceae sp. CCMP2097]
MSELYRSVAPGAAVPGAKEAALEKKKADKKARDKAKRAEEMAKKERVAFALAADRAAAEAAVAPLLEARRLEEAAVKASKAAADAAVRAKKASKKQLVDAQDGLDDLEMLNLAITSNKSAKMTAPALGKKAPTPERDDEAARNLKAAMALRTSSRNRKVATKKEKADVPAPEPVDEGPLRPLVQQIGVLEMDDAVFPTTTSVAGRLLLNEKITRLMLSLDAVHVECKEQRAIRKNALDRLDDLASRVNAL